ncbi:Thioredoxin reductase [Nonomuraea solani]|uniref:Thioredoxin reductase n=1 Tax=Nonomuraea solani TaxID=1144553 RepID=A0A1H6ESU3_9ACTN|nr:FAD-dependent oxidoreductase [Nonomuraea solani]SEG99899.1 Thioredoxin reductase [Nonomuraea solani]
MYDVIVIGGGAAGLGGALTLGRARRSVLVIDSGQPRNAPAKGVHVYLTREGMSPLDLLAAGRDEVAGYGGEIMTGTVTAVEKAGGRFRVVLGDGATVEAARLLVTTGLVDELPAVPGLAGRWGREVLHCPYCHGWEVRDQPIGVLATGPMSVHQALMWRQWSDDVTFFVHDRPDPGDEAREKLAARGITVVEGEVTGVEVTDDRLTGVRLADGRVIPRQAIAVATRMTARAGFLADLGLETAELEMGGHVMGTYIPADPSGATSVPGVWVAGNVTNLVDQVISAAAAGVRAAAAINGDLINEETEAAVTARRVYRAHGDHDSSTPEEFWDARYGQSTRLWSGDPNVGLVREAADLPPGRALDLGCGEGADAIWLASRGWRVTAADVSGVALDRAAVHAEKAGVAESIDWQRHDLDLSFPEGRYDLVSASYLHPPAKRSWEKILRSAAAAVAPGGVLLVIGHTGWPSWEAERGTGTHFPTPQEVFDDLEPAAGEWEPLVGEEFERAQNGLDGRHGTRKDYVLKLRRLR